MTIVEVTLRASALSVSMERPARSASRVGHPPWGGRSHIRKEPAVVPSVTADHGVIHLGMDVHKNTISVGCSSPARTAPVVDKISPR